MSEQVKVYADVGLDSNLLFNTSNNDFPENPSVGLFTIVNQVLYGYLRIGGMTTWYPFSSVRQSYVHTQETPSLVWTVVHNLNSENVWYQIQDTSGNLVMASKREIDANSFQLLFTVERAGTCLVVGPDVIDVPQVLMCERLLHIQGQELRMWQPFQQGQSIMVCKWGLKLR